MKLIYDYTLEDLIKYCESIGKKKFNATQIYEWLYVKKVQSFEDMSNLSKDLREKLTEEFIINPLKVAERQMAKDGTLKYLFELTDGQKIETVLMRYDYGNSVCVTSQVGCNMGCKFCASGLLKKQRDLTPGEMVAQVMYIDREMEERNQRVSHIVVMGTGEPFDNYDNVLNFVRIVNYPKGLAIGARHITISTCGIVPMIEKYSQEGLQTNLAISLHASNNEVRDELMPINKAYPMEMLRTAIKNYIEVTNRRVTFEYILLEGVNDSLVQARQLAHYMRGLNAYVNLIPYNPVNENDFNKTNKDQVNAFFEELKKLRINVTVRKEHGSDIDAACGQLRAKNLG